ncbi:hypothetical protein BV22DRAFT_1000161 [Leucogyrophana mollusca]|uniref:Uncharacterized protein n=1 Tax=Leucogyrophana mollusca TaxID=85980 RepID=A0ACB8BXD4_9AGAM|nr:hypothetical protein BV22DRAFT_1000161 [Leucogyrophana mollusca]
MGNSPSRSRPSSRGGQFGDFDRDQHLKANGLSGTLGPGDAYQNLAGPSSHRQDIPPPYSPVSPIPPFVPPASGDVRRTNGETIYVRPRPTAGVNVSSFSPSRSPVLDSMSPEAGLSLGTGSTPGSRHTKIFMLPPPSWRDSDYLRMPLRQESRENALETLRKYDTVILMDDSRSMEGPLWEEAKNALSSLAEIAATYDRDGIDVHFLNDQRSGQGLKDSAAVKKLFENVSPRGATPIGQALENLILPYLRKLEKAKKRYDKGDTFALQQIKPVNFIVITDGAPTDEPEEVIVAAAKRLDVHNAPLTQLGIQFVQIGNSKKAAAYLQELDDSLGSTRGVRDIVDTTPYFGTQLTAEMLIKILLGGINRRVDRKGAAAVMD